MKQLQKKQFLFVLAVVMLMGIAALMGGCGPTKKMGAWVSEGHIKEPLKAVCGSKVVSIGDLDTHKVEVTFQAGAFTGPTEVMLLNPTKAPGFDPSRMIGLGPPIEIRVGTKESRFLQPATVRIKYDSAELGEDLESGALSSIYHNGKEWEPVKVDVDRENQIISFPVSHSGLFGVAKLPTDTRVEQHITNTTLESWVSTQSNKITEDALGKIIDDTLQEQLEIVDQKLKEEVLISIIEDDAWVKILENLGKGDSSSFNEELQNLLGSKIVEIVPHSTLVEALEKVTGSAELKQKASQAAEYIAAGKTAEAAQLIGEHFPGKSLLNAAVVTAVAAMEHQLKGWANEEVEAAYNVFVNGASSSNPWWGYEAKKGDFEQIWEQMGGAAIQLINGAIDAQEQARKDAGLPPLTEAEKDAIAEMVKADLEKQFKERQSAEKEIARIKAEYQQIFDMFKNEGFLEKGELGWCEGKELEQHLDSLLSFVRKLLKDTGRSHVISKGSHTDEAVTIKELESAAKAWFGAPSDEARSEEYGGWLLESYGISLGPTLDEIVGTYGGTMTIQEVYISDALKAEIEKSNVEGCDIAMLAQLENIKGEANPTSLSIIKTSDSAGKLHFDPEDGDDAGSILSFTYGNGILEVSDTVTQEGMPGQMVYTGQIEADDAGDSISLKGNIRMEMLIGELGPGHFYIDMLLQGSK